MRWFKRKSLPFDDHFSIRVETPPDPSNKHAFFFVIPDWYYAQLICLQYKAYFHSDIVTPTYVFDAYVTRGDIKIYRWYPHSRATKNFTFNVSHMFDLASYSQYAGPNYPMQEQLPQSLYLYPFDIVHLDQTNFHFADKLSAFVLTFKIWEI